MVVPGSTGREGLMRNRIGFVGCAALGLTLLMAGASDAAGLSPGAAKVLEHCQSCHGARGDGLTPSIPRLNGQQAEYMKKRLQSFLDPGSQDPHATDAMWSVVREADSTTLGEIADYFASQTPSLPNRRGRVAMVAQGLWANGDRVDYISACQACHGPNGEGHGAVPRLAGQHAVYLTNQLERLRLGLRADNVMHPNTNSMSDEQIKALVAYLAND